MYRVADRCTLYTVADRPPSYFTSSCCLRSKLRIAEGDKVHMCSKEAQKDYMLEVPIFWKSQVVHHGYIDKELAPYVCLKSWHISSLKHASAPRTSISTSRGSYHVLLHRLVALLSRANDMLKQELWKDTDMLRELLSNLPAIRFQDNNPFNCTFKNLMVGVTPLSIIDVRTEELPLSALIAREHNDVVNLEHIHTQLSNFESSEPPLSIVSKEIADRIEASPALESVIDEENRRTIDDVLNILKGA